MDFGIDTLALRHYKNLIADHLPEKWWFSAFAETFGDALSSVDLVLSKGRARGCRIHLVYEKDKSLYGKKYDVKIIALAKKYNALQIKYPNQVIQLSPFCEHQLSDPSHWLELIATNAPACQIINSPSTGGFSAKYINEIHTNKQHLAPSPQGFSMSYDGQNSLTQNVAHDKQILANAGIMFFWGEMFNLTSGPILPIPERTYVPTLTHLHSMLFLKNDKGWTTVPSNWIIKPLSEDTNDQKSNKLCIISPSNSGAISLHSMKDDSIIDTLNYFPVGTGANRFYSTRTGAEIAEKAFTQSGNYVTKVYQNGKLICMCNTGFRDGQYK